MKQWIRPAAIFLGVLAGSFLFFNISRATTFINQGDGSVASQVSNGSSRTSLKAGIDLSAIAGQNPIYITVKNDANAAPCFSGSCSYQTATGTTITHNGLFTTAKITSSTVINDLASSTDIDFDLGDLGGGNTFYGTAATTTNPGQANWYSNFGILQGPDANIFTGYLVVSTLPPSGNAIQLTFPTATTTDNFSLWRYDYQTGDATTTYGVNIVFYPTASPSQQFNIFTNVNAAPGGASGITNQTVSLVPGEWNAYVQLDDLTNSTGTAVLVLASSSITTWTIGTTSTLGALPGETASTTCTNYGLIGNEFCKVLVAGFVPNQSHLNQFSTSSDCSDLTCLAKTKAPISYIYQTITAFSGISSSTTSTAATVSSTEPLALASVWSVLGLGSLLTVFDALAALVVAAGFLLWLFTRARHFEP